MKKTDRGFVHLPLREAMVRHAIKRMWQRRGVLLSRPDYDAIAQNIRSGAIAKSCDAAKGCTAHSLTYRGQNVVAIWSPEHDCIVTFYPTLAWIERKAVTV
jgi:hypothetical protein